MWAKMSIIGVLNLKHVKVILAQLKYICKFVQRKKMWTISGTNISKNAEAIFFNFDM